MNDANPDADTDSESTEYDEDRTECPECGGDIYYEPRITHGSEYEPTGGHVCLDCTWSVIDPDSGHIQNQSQEASRQRPPACRVTTTLARQLNAYSFRYVECSENEARASAYAQQRPDEELTIHTVQCGRLTEIGTGPRHRGEHHRCPKRCQPAKQGKERKDSRCGRRLWAHSFGFVGPNWAGYERSASTLHERRVKPASPVGTDVFSRGSSAALCI